MNRNTEIGNELAAISPAVANLSSKMPFRIPEGYFELFPERMMLLIRAQMPESGNEAMPSFGQNLVNSTPFSVPEGYFEGLSGNILSKIKNAENESAADEINRISPVLANLNKVNPFVLPEGYFENLEILAARSVREEKGRVVAMGSWKKWMNYAAAAVITAILAGAVYFNLSSSGNSDTAAFPAGSPNRYTGK